MFVGTLGSNVVYRSIRFVTPFIYTNVDTLDFIATYGGAVPNLQKFLIINAGNGTLNWSATKSATWFDITPTSGTNDGAMTVSINSTTALLPGIHYQNIRLTAPNAGISSPKDVVVKYTVFGAAIDVVSDIGFPTIALGDKKDTSFTITNPGNAPLTINSVQIGGTNNTDFVLGSVSFPITIPAGGSRTFTVSFTPKSLGARNATLSINHSISGLSPTVITLRGNAIEPVPIINISPITLDFGDVILGTSKDLIVNLENKGGAKLTIDSLIVIGEDTVMFDPVLQTFPHDIAPSSTYNLGISFIPTSIGKTSAMLIIYHNAEGSPDTVLLSGNGVKLEIAIIPDTLDFGNVPIGGNITKYFQVRNDGTGPLVISSIVKGGTDATQFNRYSNPDSTNSQIIVATGQTATLSVRFAPTSNGTKSSYWVFNHNVDDTESRLYLKGNGISPTIVIDPTSINFGNVNVGNSLQRSVSITNNGTAPLVISSVSITGGVFRFINSETTIIVEPDSSYDLIVQFAPIAAIDYSGSITLTHNANGSPSTIPLRGMGLSSSIVIDPTSIDFGDVNIGDSLQKIVKIANGGNADLVISSLGLSGANISLFSFTPNPTLPITLTPSQSVDLTVKFLPTSIGVKNAEINITHNVSEISSSVPLTGRGVQPSILVNPSDNIDFGSVLANNSSSNRYITISNTGTASLLITDIEITGADALMFKRVSSPDSSVFQNITIGAGSSFVFTFNFTPTSSGVKNAKVTFIHSLGSSEINFSGIGLLSGISVTPNPLDFGEVEIGTYKDLSVVIENTGNTDLRVTGFEVREVNASLFSRFSSPDSSGIGITLTPSATYTATIRFRPDISGTKNATLDIVTNIISLSLTLNGRGAGQDISVEEPANVTNDNSTFLFQSNPNPVRSGYDAVIIYRLNIAGQVNLMVYDILGREVAKLVDEYKPQGMHSVNFNTKNLPSGIYFYKLRTTRYEGLKKMLIIR